MIILITKKNINAAMKSGISAPPTTFISMSTMFFKEKSLKKDVPVNILCCALTEIADASTISNVVGFIIFCKYVICYEMSIISDALVDDVLKTLSTVFWITKIIPFAPSTMNSPTSDHPSEFFHFVYSSGLDPSTSTILNPM